MEGWGVGWEEGGHFQQILGGTSLAVKQEGKH